MFSYNTVYLPWDVLVSNIHTTCSNSWLLTYILNCTHSESHVKITFQRALHMEFIRIPAVLSYIPAFIHQFIHIPFIPSFIHAVVISQFRIFSRSSFTVLNHSFCHLFSYSRAWISNSDIKPFAFHILNHSFCHLFSYSRAWISNSDIKSFTFHILNHSFYHLFSYSRAWISCSQTSVPRRSIFVKDSFLCPGAQ